MGTAIGSGCLALRERLSAFAGTGTGSGGLLRERLPAFAGTGVGSGLLRERLSAFAGTLSSLSVMTLLDRSTSTLVVSTFAGGFFSFAYGLPGGPAGPGGPDDPDDPDAPGGPAGPGSPGGG